MEKVKLSQFAYDMILYSSKNLQKTVRANKQIQQSCGLQEQHTKICISTPSNEQSEKEIKKAISFPKASERIKYLEINLAKEMKDIIFMGRKA